MRAVWRKAKRRRSGLRTVLGVDTALMPQLSFHSPLGALTLSEEDGALVAVDWGFGRDQVPTPLLQRARDQVQAYFDGTLRHFDLPLAPQGTSFRLRVWQKLRSIPYGCTISYGELVAQVGGSARAIGGANGANPLPIIIPCHRVVARKGVGGYSGGEGVSTKQWLLAHEVGSASDAVQEAQ